MRLFIALDLPDAEKQRLEGLLTALRAAALPVRWVAADSLHITIKFLGSVPDSTQAQVTRALKRAAAGSRPFDVVLGGFGAFPSRNKPEILWIGATLPAELSVLQERIEAETEPLGFGREPRRFHPHITIGRAQKRPARVDPAELDRILASLVYKSVMRVESVDLMRSHTDGRGARYERIERHGLSD